MKKNWIEIWCNFFGQLPQNWIMQRMVHKVYPEYLRMNMSRKSEYPPSGWILEFMLENCDFTQKNDTFSSLLSHSANTKDATCPSYQVHFAKSQTIQI